MKVTLEIAVSTVDEAVAAAQAGADRLELSSALELGGLTPSPGLFTHVRRHVSRPIWVLLRPRPGGFVYTANELAVVVSDAKEFLAAGANGLVFGALDESGRVAEEACRTLAAIARGRIAFHRAFDFIADRHEALERLIGMGYQRVLTSGGRRTALEGSVLLADLVTRAAGRIAIMPGGGIRPENVAEVVRLTGCREVHAAARSSRLDASLAANAELAPAMGANSSQAISTTDGSLVSGLRRELDRLTSLT